MVSNTVQLQLLRSKCLGFRKWVSVNVSLLSTDKDCTVILKSSGSEARHSSLHFAVDIKQVEMEMGEARSPRQNGGLRSLFLCLPQLCLRGEEDNMIYMFVKTSEGKKKLSLRAENIEKIKEWLKDFQELKEAVAEQGVDNFDLKSPSLFKEKEEPSDKRNFCQNPIKVTSVLPSLSKENEEPSIDKYFCENPMNVTSGLPFLSKENEEQSVDKNFFEIPINVTSVLPSLSKENEEPSVDKNFFENPCNVTSGLDMTEREHVPEISSRLSRVQRVEEDMEGFDYNSMFRSINPQTANKDTGSFRVIRSIVSQLLYTLNPNKVRLPACVLECRSLLEAYADAFGRPELFARIPEGVCPVDRLIRVTAFYLSQMKCMRPVNTVTKPYNPVLGEVFVCQWPLAGQPLGLQFLAEQVSHHPPVTAMYAECRAAGISLTSTIFTKSGMHTSWLPPFLEALTVDNIGQATVNLLDHREQYTFNYPCAVASGVLGRSPHLRLTGSTVISCNSHRGRVELNFTGNSLVTGRVLQVGETEEVVANVSGDWRGLVKLVWQDRQESLLDMQAWTGPEQDKVVVPVEHQEDRESMRLWRFLTRALSGYDSEVGADAAKRKVEDWEKAKREEENFEFTPEFFFVNEDFNATFKYA